jgi:hypothetical protein
MRDADSQDRAGGSLALNFQDGLIRRHRGRSPEAWEVGPNHEAPGGPARQGLPCDRSPVPLPVNTPTVPEPASGVVNRRLVTYRYFVDPRLAQAGGVGDLAL